MQQQELAKGGPLKEASTYRPINENGTNFGEGWHNIFNQAGASSTWAASPSSRPPRANSTWDMGQALDTNREHVVTRLNAIDVDGLNESNSLRLGCLDNLLRPNPAGPTLVVFIGLEWVRLDLKCLVWVVRHLENHLQVVSKRLA